MKIMTEEKARKIVLEEGWADSVKFGILRNPDSALERILKIYLEGFYQGYYHAIQEKAPRIGWQQEPYGE